ncbi:SLC35A3 [Cordylochernes scorpioides]|uniref:SLC35A3 n=1 Tax=Cordylochernes scorpioides TaxID=51811 RepID=A0ABY6LED3_9ARAC|nr:SLC35A3 [Cordylochernes scorpioides]
MQLKSVTLAILVVETSCLVLLLRYSRTMDQPSGRYLSSTAVFLAEVVKLTTSFFFLFLQSALVLEVHRCQLIIPTLKSANAINKKTLHCVAPAVSGKDLRQFGELLHKEVWRKPLETLKMSGLAGLYTLQNNLTYLALTNLEAATYQLIIPKHGHCAGDVPDEDHHNSHLCFPCPPQATLPAAVDLPGVADGWSGPSAGEAPYASMDQFPPGKFSIYIYIYFTNIEANHVVQLTISESDDSSTTPEGSPMIGLLSVFAASVLSGFSGIYFEKVIKGTSQSLWIREVQLSELSQLGLSITWSSIQ